MRIVITRSNPVDPDSRVEKEANSLSKAGHTVVLLTWDRGANHPNIEDIKELSNTTVRRIKIGAKAQFGAGLKSLFPYIRFQLRLFGWLIKNRKMYDVCHLCDFDTAFTGNIAARLCGKKVVFDLFDYLSTDPRSLFRKFIKKLENHIINHADATIICTEQRKKQIQGTKPRKLVIIHNSPDKIAVGNIKLKSSSKLPKIVYVGVLDERQRMLKELVQCVAENGKVELHVGGFGILENFMLEAQEKYDNVFFYGKIPYQDTLALESQCDIITAIYNPTIGNSRYAAPKNFMKHLC
jgi:effector-binding domain-containing protein